MYKKYILLIVILAAGIVVGLLLPTFDISKFDKFANAWGSLLLSATLVVVTIYYAWQTRQSVKIMEENSLPYVSLHLENEPSHINDIYLVIRNDGNQPAFDVELDVMYGDIDVLDGIPYKQKLSELGAIKSTLSVLSPKSERRHLIIMSTPDKWRQIENVRTTIKVTFRDKKRRSYGYDSHLDYASLPFVGQPRNSTYQKAEKSLQSIDLTLKEIAKK